MKYSKSYQQTRDIDWFFRDGEHLVHVATNGGPLPDFVNDVQRLRRLQARVSDLSDKCNVSEADEYIDERFSDPNNFSKLHNQEHWREDYVRSFRSMAQKGFFSFDRDRDDIYHLICEPYPIIDSSSFSEIPACSDEIVFLNKEHTMFRIIPSETTPHKDGSNEEEKEEKEEPGGKTKTITIFIIPKKENAEQVSHASSSSSSSSL